MKSWNKAIVVNIQGNQRQPVQRNPLTAETTKDLRILKNIKPGAKAPQTTATSPVAFMNVDSLRSLIEEVLHGFFKKQRLDPTGLPQPTISKSSLTSIDVVSSNVHKPAQTLTKDLNLLQLNMSAGTNFLNSTFTLYTWFWNMCTNLRPFFESIVQKITICYLDVILTVVIFHNYCTFLPSFTLECSGRWCCNNVLKYIIYINYIV